MSEVVVDHAGVDRSTRLVEQLLSLARLEHGLLCPSRKNIDLKEFVQKELREIAPLPLQKSRSWALKVGEKSL